MISSFFTIYHIACLSHTEWLFHEIIMCIQLHPYTLSSGQAFTTLVCQVYHVVCLSHTKCKVNSTYIESSINSSTRIKHLVDLTKHLWHFLFFLQYSTTCQPSCHKYQLRACFIFLSWFNGCLLRIGKFNKSSCYKITSPFIVTKGGLHFTFPLCCLLLHQMWFSGR